MRQLACTLTILLVYAATPLKAQQDTLIRYFDHKFREVAPPDASDTALTIRGPVDGGGFQEQDFYLSNGKIMRRAYFTDASRAVRTGPYEAFHRNGKRKIRGQYANGLHSGTWRGWDDEGVLSDSVQYNDKGNMTGLRIVKQPGFVVKDSIFYAADGSGRGQCRGRFANGVVAQEGPMLNDALDGEWTFYHRSGQLAARETYKADELVRSSCFDEKGKPVAGDCKPELEADFPGGIPAWSAFVISKMEAHYKTLVKKDANGQAVVQFVVDTAGKVTDVSLYRGTGTYLDEYAVKLIKDAPNWKPARLHNVTVKAYRRQPIVFRLED